MQSETICAVLLFCTMVVPFLICFAALRGIAPINVLLRRPSISTNELVPVPVKRT